MVKPINPKLKWVERVSYLMDEKFRIPGTKFRFGLDPILNLFPVLGDLAGLAVSSALLFAMARHGASRKLLILMSLNVALDSTIGAIPVIGQIFDFAYKSNSRNIKLLKEHYEEGKHQGKGTGLLILLLAILIGLIVVFVYLVYALISWISGYL